MLGVVGEECTTLFLCFLFFLDKLVFLGGGGGGFGSYPLLFELTTTTIGREGGSWMWIPLALLGNDTGLLLLLLLLLVVNGTPTGFGGNLLWNHELSSRAGAIIIVTLILVIVVAMAMKNHGQRG